MQQPKVVVQRNSDMLQTAANMAQIVDQNSQPIQYQFATQMDQGQGQQQLIIQQAPQIKQTIYPQQPNQVSKLKHSSPTLDLILGFSHILGCRTATILPAAADSTAIEHRSTRRD
jgi:hypothetical protein